MADLSPEMRAEITEILRSSGPGLGPGAVFRSLESGMTPERIAAGHNSDVAHIRQIIASLNNLFDANSVPASKAAARGNAQVFRELLNHHPSPELHAYVEGRLTALMAVHPDFNTPPSRPRTTRRTVSRPAPVSRENTCPSCGLTHAGECF